MPRSSEIRNKSARKDAYLDEKKQRKSAKLKRRMEQRKAELADPSLREERLRTNVPTTVENSKEWVGAGWRSGGRELGRGEVEDRRTMPVQLVGGSAADDGVVVDPSSMQLDMAGLEDLFPDEEPLQMGPIPSTSAQDPEAALQPAADGADEADAADAGDTAAPTEPKPRGLVLITTGPHPCDATLAFADEFASLLGGPKYAQIVPRRTAKFELSKVCKWASKRGYSALVVIGEDHGDPSSMTVSKLPLGPSAHFRLTSVFLSKEINGHGNPTSHAPELVLSNMATPLGLSIGRLLGALFPPLPQIHGRQVVAVHNQRDYIFLRRFRYMFAVRGDSELDQQRAKERGMDPTVRTRMQEIGPRLTLKLRWLKRGTLETGRRKGGGGVTGAHQQVTTPEEDKADVEVAEFNPDAAQADGGAEPEPEPDANAAPEDDPAAPSPVEKPVKRKKARTHTSKGGIRIPRLSIPDASLPDARNDFRRKKRKAGDSILEGVFLQGGMRDDALEWQWNPRMSLSKRKHFL